MEKNNKLNPQEDQQLWEDILNGKKSDILTPLLLDEEQEMWGNILTGIRERELKKKRKRIRKYTILATITLLLIIGGLIGYRTAVKPDVYAAAASGIRTVQLSDGSAVTLFKGAKLTVEKSFPADTREVLLEGDAIFKVAKSKLHPFIVHGNGYETKVLGTVFKVSQYGRTFNVDLYEGKVLVYRKGHSKDPVALKPQQTFSNLGIPEIVSVTKTATDQSAEAKPATLTFHKCLIKDAVQVIEKTYAIKVQYPAELENASITVSLPNASAGAFLQSLSLQFNLTIKQNNDSTFELEN